MILYGTETPPVKLKDTPDRKVSAPGSGEEEAEDNKNSNNHGEEKERTDVIVNEVPDEVGFSETIYVCGKI